MDFKIPNEKYDHILFDSNNFFNRYYAVQSAKTKEESFEANKGSIGNSLKGVQKVLREHGTENTHLYFLFDNAKSKMNVRKLIDPSYKLNRQRKHDSFYRALDYFRLILLSYKDNMTVVYGTGHEADDIAPVVASKLGGRKLLVSEDMDWCRLIDDDVQLLTRKGIIGKKEFLERYGFSPTENSVILYKAIHGDSVDNIPVGILNFPKDLTVKLIDDYTDVYDIKENLEIIPYLKDHWRAKIKESMPRLYLNHQLVSYIDLSKADIANCTFQCSFKPKVLTVLYNTLSLDVKTTDRRLFEMLENKKPKKKVDDFFELPEMKRW